MFNELDGEIENNLFEYFSKTYPMVFDFSYEIDGDLIKLTSSTSFTEANPKLEEYYDVEKILNAKFIGVLDENGKYSSIFRFNR